SGRNRPNRRRKPGSIRSPCASHSPCCGGPMRIVEIFHCGQIPRSRAPPRERAA
ncbi:IS91 family transposase, partial [Roseibium sp. RKSG952]|nr:IS91 family transposase [Roseibium sp. RKSG952]